MEAKPGSIEGPRNQWYRLVGKPESGQLTTSGRVGSQVFEKEVPGRQGYQDWDQLPPD